MNNRFILNLSRANIFQVETYTHKQQNETLKAALVKILIDFMQVLNLILQLDIRWPSTVIVT